MDYKEKYKQALERAREKYAVFKGMKQGDVLEDVFPELAESEDEKIRKRIIALVNAHGQGRFKESMLAWLEKQGEKNPAKRKPKIEQREATGVLKKILDEEDEKIRKWIINDIKAHHHNLDEENVDIVDTALAWLEKQKSADEDTTCRTTGYWVVEDPQVDVEKLCKDIIKYSNGIMDFVLFSAVEKALLEQGIKIKQQ